MESTLGDCTMSDLDQFRGHAVTVPGQVPYVLLRPLGGNDRTTMSPRRSTNARCASWSISSRAMT
jgi:hypothetical protein